MTLCGRCLLAASCNKCSLVFLRLGVSDLFVPFCLTFTEQY